jgi:hypothetical protein
MSCRSSSSYFPAHRQAKQLSQTLELERYNDYHSIETELITFLLLENLLEGIGFTRLIFLQSLIRKRQRPLLCVGLALLIQQTLLLRYKGDNPIRERQGCNYSVDRANLASPCVVARRAAKRHKSAGATRSPQTGDRSGPAGQPACVRIYNSHQ